MRFATALGLFMALASVPASALACKYPPGPPNSHTNAVDTINLGVFSAGFTHATSRYRHGVLGDAIEGGGLIILARRADGSSSTPCRDYIVLPEDRVFEDLAPRIADVTGNGWNDVVVVEAEVSTGAALAIYSYVPDADVMMQKGQHRGRIRKIASTPHIGQPNRWLGPAGIADFDGDGQNDIAYVQTPHIGGILRLWTMRNGALVEIAEPVGGVSNHRIGEDFISGGVRDCGDGPELVLATANWSGLVRARMVDGAWQIDPISPSIRPEAWDRAMNCE